MIIKYLAFFSVLIFSVSSIADSRRSVNLDKIDHKHSEHYLRTGLLLSGASDVKSQCTATIISDRHILTAAHCVIDVRTGKALSQIEFYPQYLGKKKARKDIYYIHTGFVIKNFYSEVNRLSRKGFSQPTPAIVANDIAVLEAIKEPNSQYNKQSVGAGVDYGFNQPYFSEDGYVGIDNKALVFSYPGDKAGVKMWGEECLINTAGGKKINTTTCKVAKGASGSGLRQYFPQFKSYFITGVISTDTGYAAMLNRKRFMEIRSIINGEPLSHDADFSRVHFNTKRNKVYQFVNACRSDKVTIYVKANLGNGKGSQFYKLSTLNYNEATFLDEIHGRDMHFVGIGNKHHWANDSSSKAMIQVNGKTYPMLHKYFNGNSFLSHRFECN